MESLNEEGEKEKRDDVRKKCVHIYQFTPLCLSEFGVRTLI